MKVSKLRVGLLSLIVLVQGLTIVGGFMAYHQMSERYSILSWNYLELLREHYPGLEIHPGGPGPSNPFMFLLLLVLFGAFLTSVLLVDEMRQK